MNIWPQNMVQSLARHHHQILYVSVELVTEIHQVSQIEKQLLLNKMESWHVQILPFQTIQQTKSFLYSINWRETAKIMASLPRQKSPGLHLPQLLKNTKAYLSVHQHVWGLISHPIAALPIIISLCHVPQIWSAFGCCTVKGKSGFNRASPQVSLLPWWLIDLTCYQHVIKISVCAHSNRYLHGSEAANSPFTVITLFCW